MSDDILIRPYRPGDRDAVRQICCDTANCGRPIESVFKDRQFVADLVTSYYTDYEPESLWIAEDAGQAIGYLTGCFDIRRYNLKMIRCIIPRVFISCVFRGTLVQKETWRMLRAGLKTWRLGGFRKNIPLDKYPIHLHIDIKEEFRGKSVGQRLMEKFFDQARKRGAQGIHVITREDNKAACRFFERMGFVILSRHPMFVLDKEDFLQSHTLVYVKSI